MTYQERWNITAKLLGYRIVPARYHAMFRAVSPDGTVLIYGNRDMDFTNYIIVEDIERRFPDIKWDYQLYSQ